MRKAASADAHAADVAARHRQTLAGEEFVLVGSWNPGTVVLYGSQSSSGKVLVQAGAKISAVEDAAVAGSPPMSLR